MPPDAAAVAGGTARAGTARPTRDWMRLLLPALALAVLIAVIFGLQPRAMSYNGLRLLLGLSTPLIFASMAQLCIIAAGDIDLGIGPFIALVSCITATFLVDRPAFGWLALGLCVLAYAALGALIQLRSLPSIVATLGASFVWLGIAVMVMPQPGGAAPDWLQAAVRLRPPGVPLPVLVAVVVGLAGHWLLMRTAFGVVLRGFGGNPRAIARAGWSALGARVALYGAAGVCGVLAGLAITGINTTGDSSVGAQYTLLSIAAVIVGGGEFVGGVVSPIGTVIGALIMLLSGSLLAFLKVNPDWQLSLQGAILIAVLAGRALRRRDRQ